MFNNLYWVGIRQSEIEMISNLFCGSVCLFGETNQNHIAYSDERGNQNIPSEEMHNFYLATLNKIILENPDSKFMFYNQNKAYIYGNNILEHSICYNHKMILDDLIDKSWARKVLSQIVTAIPSVEVNFSKTNIIKAAKIFNGYKKFIIQKPISGGGNGTFLFDIENESIFINCIKDDERVLISPYIEKSFSVNTTLVIGDQNFIILPSSIQIIEYIDNKFLYRGADYLAFESLKNDIKEKVNQNAENIARYLKSLGYRGVIGIDSLVDGNDEVFFVELNNRFQASTDLINIALSEENTSVQELNILAFGGKFLPDLKIRVNLSSYFYYNETECDFNDVKYKYQSFLRQINNENVKFKLISDGFDINAKLSNNCYGFKVNFQRRICMPSPDGNLWINENIRFFNPALYNSYKNNLLKLKTALLNQGVCLADNISNNVKAAVYESIDLNIDFQGKKATLNCPYRINYSELSPFLVDENEMLNYCGQALFKIEIDKSGIPSEAKTSSGKQITQIVYMSEDRLRIKTMSGCDFKKNNIGCDFCNNSPKCTYFSPEDIIESINYAVALYGKRLRHFLIGGGTDFRDNYWETVEHIVNFINANNELPKEITLMVAPFDTIRLSDLKKLNISDLSINIEIYDDATAGKLMKGKGKARQLYFDFFEKAKFYWENFGDLRSMIMVGFDKTENLFKLIDKLAHSGVQPVLSIFRPLPNTPMEDYIMPPNEYLENIYYKCSDICFKVNPQYRLGPKCPACKNNVLAL